MKYIKITNISYKLKCNGVTKTLETPLQTASPKHASHHKRVPQLSPWKSSLLGCSSVPIEVTMIVIKINILAFYFPRG